MQQILSHQQLVDIANEFGTPVYVYHAERIAEQYHKLKNAFKAYDLDHLYSPRWVNEIK